MELIQIWVIKWKYGDNSGCGIVRAYETDMDAKEDLAMLEFQGDNLKKFEIKEVLMMKEGKK